MGKQIGEFARRRCLCGFDTHAIRKLDPSKVRVAQGPSCRARRVRIRADVHQFVEQDCVLSIRQQHGRKQGSFSRAWVHNACSVYMAEPSAWSATTRRPGQASAAPVAIGNPLPIEAPVICSQSCGTADARPLKSDRPKLTLSSTTMALSGSIAARMCVDRFRRYRCVQIGVGRFGGRHGQGRCRQFIGKPCQRICDILIRPGQDVNGAILREEMARLTGIGEWRNRRRCSRKNEIFVPDRAATD